MHKTWILSVAALAAFLFAADRAMADVLRLKAGEVLKGRPIQARSDEYVLVFEDVLNGSLRSFSWEAVDDRDRERLQSAWRISSPMLSVVEGHRVRVKLEGGASMDVLGLLSGVREGMHRLLQTGKVVEIPSDSVAWVRPELMDPRDIWSPNQLVTRFLEHLRSDGADLTDLSSRARFHLAEYARLVEAYETARAHYAACAMDEAFPSAARARLRLDEVESLLRDSAAMAELRAIRMAIRRRSYRSARARLTRFVAEHDDIGTESKERLASTHRMFARKRAAHLQAEARRRFPKLVLQRIESKVRTPKVELRDLIAWTRRELPEAAFADLARILGRWDDVTPDEARGFWERRSKSSWRTATYGSGTYIVESPAAAKPGKKPGARPARPLSKPPTRDQWWHRTSPRERAAWLAAYFIERSGLFEISEATIARRSCPTCAGRGWKNADLCPRCWGARTDRRVRYR